jgi:hypothetical protein
MHLPDEKSGLVDKPWRGARPSVQVKLLPQRCYGASGEGMAPLSLQNTDEVPHAAVKYR